MHFFFWLIVMFHPNYQTVTHHPINANIANMHITRQDVRDAHALSDALENELTNPKTRQMDQFILTGIEKIVGGN